MKKLICIGFLLLINGIVSGQCDSIKLGKILNILKYVDPAQKSYLKWSFDKVSEDTSTYVYARCPWDGEINCFPFKEYLLMSKVKRNYARFQCYDKGVYDSLKKEIMSTAVVQTSNGINYYLVENNILINVVEMETRKFNCNIKMVYIIEFLKQ
ncbi:MAG: hypothetical protein HOP11_14815 [Saprospiraceae bacterium]|nr:hypothetical protein [Saprospiraceae bacterium]